MKRIFIVVAVALLGMVSLPETASAQWDLSKLTGLFKGGSSSSSQKKSPYQTLAENAPTTKRVVGLWNYKNFSIDYLGTNAFAEAAISQIESIGREELMMAGIKAGSFSVRLNANGSGSFCYEDYVYDGSYTYDSSTARFRIQAMADNGKTLTCGGYLKMSEDGELIIMLKAEDAVRAFKTMLPDADDDSTFEMIEGVVSNFSGLYLSLRCTR